MNLYHFTVAMLEKKHPFQALPFLAAAAMAAPSASGIYGYGAPVAYAPAYGPAAQPPSFKGLVSYPNGAVVPIEPASVQAARADHFAAKAAYGAPAYGYAGYGYGH